MEEGKQLELEERRVVVSLKSPPPASASSSGPSGAGKTSASNPSLVRNPFFDDDGGGSLACLQHRQHPLSDPALGLGSGSSLSPPSSRSASPVSTLGHRKDRATRRSADVLLHMRAIDDENRARLQQQSSSGIRETSKADIATDEIGALMGVNEYCVVKELGRGAFAEVKLCRKQVGSPAASPFSSPCPSPVPMPVSEGEEEGGSPISRGRGGEGEELYAIKVFSKSLLLRRKKFQRGQQGRMAVVTDLDKVQREVAIMKKLVHPYLVKLFEVIDDAGKDALYLVLEYVPGGAVMEYCAEERRYFYPRSWDGLMAEGRAAQVLCDMLAGLVFLHMHHICHRDLKPENVLVDQHGRCKIADFGVAHYFEEEEVTKGAPAELGQLYRSLSRGLLSKSDGTWCFWAPEMCRSRSFSGYSCDIWAAGVCLWVFVFGSLPFQEDSPDELFEAICEQEPPFPDDTREISPELQDLLRQFLHKAPTNRITLGDALDHPWSQLADEETPESPCAAGASPGRGLAGGEAAEEATPALSSPWPSAAGGMRGSLRSRAYSFRRVHVTVDEVQDAIRSVNNFVLVSKLRKKLTKKLREARASLMRASPSFTSPVVSPANSPPGSPGGSSSPHHHHHRARSSPADPMAGDEVPSKSKGRRSTFGSPVSFLPPALAAALSSSPGTSESSSGSPGGDPKPPSQHRKKSSLNLSAGSLSGFFRPSLSVVERFGKAEQEEEEEERENGGAAVTASVAGDGGYTLASILPPVEEQRAQQFPQATATASSGKPPRSPRSGSPPLPSGQRKGAKPRSPQNQEQQQQQQQQQEEEEEEGKQQGCSLM